MAARMFRITLFNNTKYPLRKRPEDFSLKGEWTPGGWEPPDVIQPNTEGHWMSENEYFWEGTGGTLVYRLDLDDTGVEHWPYDEVALWWNNPVSGRTNSTAGMRVSPHVPVRPDNVERLVSHKHKFEVKGGGARPMDSYPGIASNEGWLEVFPAFFPPLPIPFFGVLPHAWSAFLVNEVDSPPEPFPTFEDAGPDLLAFSPMNGGPPEAWQNSWVYPAGYEDQAELKVSVNLEPGLPLRNVGGQPNPVFFSVKLSEKGKSVGIPAFVVNEGGIPESIARSYRYQRNIWPPRPHHGALNIIASLSRRGLSQRSPSLLITSQPKPSNAFDPFESADSLVLSSSNVTLMLYAVHIIGGPTIGYCVRYLRHGEDGGVVADVMLRPAMTRIR